jgi:hypothetical protein
VPIRESEKARYPKDWRRISLEIRARDGQACACTGHCGQHPHERCGAPNGAMIERDPAEPWRWVAIPLGELVGALRGVRVILTVAHLDHAPENCDPANLLAMCQRCHLRYDSAHHAANAARTRIERRGPGLFGEVTRG